jgi:hypothetical protein
MTDFERFERLYRPIQLRFRRKRMANLIQTLGISANTKVLDLGGTPLNWELIGFKPYLTMLNIEGEEWSDGKARYLVYDGYSVPFPDDSFDVCFSNSVIEHVPCLRMALFAREVRRLAPAYYVQTPNRRFFFEPHFMGVFLHWLPKGAMRRLVRHFTLAGIFLRPSQAWIDWNVAEINLLAEPEIRALFPDAEIIKERFFGAAKSLIAVRLSRPRQATP